MATPTTHNDGLTLLLGPRQADIMRLFWDHGPTTVRQLQRWRKDSNLAYIPLLSN